MKRLNKVRKTGKVRSYRGPMLKADIGMYAWAKPYTDSNIDNVATGLGGNFRYSPIFKNVIDYFTVIAPEPSLRENHQFSY